MPAIKMGHGSTNATNSGTGSSITGGAGNTVSSVIGSVVGNVTGAAGGVLSGASALSSAASASNSDGMRGLALFISDIRNCKSREAEIKRINKELANIRNKFKGDKTLDGYQKKKYVCKLLFIFLLGHDIDFGYMEAVNLLSSNKYTEKHIGYLFISVLISPDNDLMKLVVQSLKNDLKSRNPIFVCLALNCISNLGSSREMAEAFGQDIPKFLTSGESSDSIKQSASLCLLKLLREHSDALGTNISEWGNRVIHLLNDQHLGVVTAACSLINELVSRNPIEYKTCASLAVSRLSRIVTASYTDLQDYTYYFVPAPWLCVQLLRLLQNWPLQTPTYFDAATRIKLLECLETLLNKAAEPAKSKKVQHSNARNAVLFEAIDLIAHCYATSDGIRWDKNNEISNGTVTCTDLTLMGRACEMLTKFLSHRETNLRFLALESLGNLLRLITSIDNSNNDPESVTTSNELISKYLSSNRDVIVSSLRNERDPSVRRGAADLLYASCSAQGGTDCEFVCEQLSDYLTGEGCIAPADYVAREETVLKMADLAERYGSDRRWYLDTILNLIRMAGDHVSDEVWFRAVQVVVNHEDLQGYAAKAVYEALVRPPIKSRNNTSSTANAAKVVDYFYCHENLIKVAGYILGEFGNLIAGDPRSAPSLQFTALHSKFPLCSNSTRAMLLSTYIKFVNLFPEIKDEILQVLNSDANIRSSDPEIQQRAVEYVKLCESVSPDVLAVVLEEMPPFPQHSSSASLLSKLMSNASGSAQNSKKLSGSTPINQRKISSNHKSPISGKTIIPTSHQNGAEDLLNISSPNATDDLPNHDFDSSIITMTYPTKKDKDILPHQKQEIENVILSKIFAPTTTISDFSAQNSNKHQTDLFAQRFSNPNDSTTKAPQSTTSPSSTLIMTKSIPFSEIAGKFVCKNAGILYEDDLVQIGAKLNNSSTLPNSISSMSYTISLTLYYGNKSQSTRITAFQTGLKLVPGSFCLNQPDSNLTNNLDLHNGIDVQNMKCAQTVTDNYFACEMEPMTNSTLNTSTTSIIEPLSQIQQKATLKFLTPTTQGEYAIPRIMLEVSFNKTTNNIDNKKVDPFATVDFDPFNPGNQNNFDVNPALSTDISNLHCVSTYLPLCINKFFDMQTPQTQMDQPAFFQRWKALVSPGQEFQKIFNAQLPIDTTDNRLKISQFGLTLLDDIDQNIDNIVATGILSTESRQPIGCLLRLEPNRKTNMYRLTIRSTRAAISRELGYLLTETCLF